MYFTGRRQGSDDFTLGHVFAKRMSSEIRDWCSIMPAGASLKNCYRARKGDMDGEETFAVPQSFTFMAREGTRIKKTCLSRASKIQA